VRNLTREDSRVLDITDGSTLHHVPHSETLDSLVLRYTTRAVGAANEHDVATAVLVSATISSFLGLLSQGKIGWLSQLHPAT
jgi:hypothetical protein